MPVIEIKSQDDFNQRLGQVPPSQLVVIDFTAAWCGPCKAIAPVFLQLSNKTLHATFLKVDVDKVKAVAQTYRVSAMPTFIFLRAGSKIDEMKGADATGLTERVNRLAGPAPQSFASSSASSATSGLSSLRPLIDGRDVHCLNEASDHPFKPLVSATPSPSAYLESDADEQLLFTIPFLQPCRLKAIAFKISSDKVAQAPKRIKLFVNRPSLGFDEAESDQPQQEFELTKKQIDEGGVVQLRLVKFQGVGSLHVFIHSNQEDEESTRLDGIEVFGEAQDVTSRDALQKVED